MLPKNFIERFAAFFIVVFAGFGCASMETIESTKIAQDEIRQSYDITASRTETSVRARFSYMPTHASVDLDAPSSIFYNGQELPQNTVNFLTGTFYYKRFEGFQPRSEFVYTNGDGKAFRNQVNIEPVDFIVTQFDINRTKETTIPLSRAVKTDEIVSIHLESRQKPVEISNANARDAKDDPIQYDLYLSDELNNGRHVIVLKPKNLKKFAAGAAVLRISVKGSVHLKEANRPGGEINWIYESTADVHVAN